MAHSPLAICAHALLRVHSYGVFQRCFGGPLVPSSNASTELYQLVSHPAHVDQLVLCSRLHVCGCRAQQLTRVRHPRLRHTQGCRLAFAERLRDVEYLRGPLQAEGDLRSLPWQRRDRAAGSRQGHERTRGRARERRKAVRAGAGQPHSPWFSSTPSSIFAERRKAFLLAQEVVSCER